MASSSSVGVGTLGYTEPLGRCDRVETVGQNTVKIHMNFPSSAFLRWFAVDPAKVVPKPPL